MTMMREVLPPLVLHCPLLIEFFSIDFEDTYDGLGDRLDDDQDAFNDDTFGGGGGDEDEAPPVGRDFDFFGKTAQVSDVIGEEQLRYNLQNPKTAAAAAAAAADNNGPTQAPKRTGYEKYQDESYIPDLQAKSSVWGISLQNNKQLAATAAPPPAEVRPAPAKKMLSLEEVEAQLSQQNQHPPPPRQPSIQPPPELAARPMQIPPFPDGFLPPEIIHAQLAPPQQVLPHPPLAPELYHVPPAAPINIPPPPPQQLAPALLQQFQDIPPRVPRHHHMHPPPVSLGGLPLITNPQQLMNLSEEQRAAYLIEDARRAKRNHKIFLLSKGNGLMTPQDKNFITRIQLQQLVAAAGNVADSADPEATLAEDFYYQVYSQIRGAPRQHPRQPLGHFAQTYLFQTGNRVGGHGGRRNFYGADNHMQRMQQQVLRAVEAAKLKPKNKQLVIEGSLGKISFSNANAPRAMLNIKRPAADGGSDNTAVAAAKAPKKPHPDLSVNDRKSILGNIEKVYGTLMATEDMERTMPPPPDEDDPDAIQDHMEWRQKIQALNQKLWHELKVMEPIVPGSSTPHPFISFLSYPKGKKAVPRIFRHVDQEQRVTILTMIIVHLDSLDVVQRAQPMPGDAQPPLAVREAIDLFSQAVMPCLLGYVSEAPFNIIIGLLGLVIAQTHVQMVAKTRIGLGILTMLLSRAEIVKEAGQATEQDWQQWVEKFNVLFDSLESILGDIFPGSINAGDDMYVWQFLAALGIGASPEQQQRLVIGVK